MTMGKNDKIVIICVLVVFAGIAILHFYREGQLNKDGIFVVGRVTRTVEDDNGYGLTIVYEYKDNSYQFHYKALPWSNDSLVFVHILWI